MSFDHHDPQFVRDPESVFGPLRDEHPLEHSDLYGGFWVITRYDEVIAATPSGRSSRTSCTRPGEGRPATFTAR